MVEPEEEQLLQGRIAGGSAREAAIVNRSLAAAGRSSSPTDPDTFVKSRVGFAHRLEAGVLDPTAELDGRVRPAQLLVDEGGKSA